MNEYQRILDKLVSLEPFRSEGLRAYKDSEGVYRVMSEQTLIGVAQSLDGEKFELRVNPSRYFSNFTLTRAQALVRRAWNLATLS